MSRPKMPTTEFYRGAWFAVDQARKAHAVGLTGEQIADHIARVVQNLEDEYGAEDS